MIGPAIAAGGAAFLAYSLRFTWWRPRRPGTPILMYHQVGASRPGSALNKWRVSAAFFERQLRHLAARGYQGVALRDLLERPNAAMRRVAITFDDGYEGVLRQGLPLLRAHGFGATVFAVAAKTGQENDWDGDRPGDRLLSADGLRELHAAGLEIGSHGATHRALPPLSDAELDAETRGSRETLESIVGAPVVSFCYPYGAFDDRSVAAVARAGYRAATVIRGGILPDLSDPYRLKRVAVRGTDTLHDFRLALTRGRSRL